MFGSATADTSGTVRLVQPVSSASWAWRRTLKDENADTAAVRQAVDRTTQAAQKIGTTLYEKSRAEQSAGAPAGGTADDSSEDEVVDAEIVDEDKPEAA